MSQAYEIRLNRIFYALSDSSRRKMLGYLSGGETTVKEISKYFKMTLAGVSKHLMVLEKAGLIFKSKEGRLRHCAINPKAIDEAEEVLKKYRVMWNTQLDNLEKYLTQNNPGSGPGTEES